MPALILCPTILEAKRLFSGELSTLETRGECSTHLGGIEVQVNVCGFGLAAAGVGAFHHMSRHKDRAQCVILAGIAGTLNDTVLPPGSILVADKVICVGIGVGEGASHIGCDELGFSQALMIDGQAIGGTAIELSESIGGRPTTRCGTLLSVPSAAGSFEESARRKRLFPDALAEDMESFSVALAARVLEVPLIVLRGISDRSGERDKSKWKTKEAFTALRAGLEETVKRTCA